MISPKNLEQKSEQKATIFSVENKFNHDERCVTTTFHALTTDGTEIKKTSVNDFKKDEFNRYAYIKWSNSMLCNFLKTTAEELSQKLPYQPCFDVRVKYTKSVFDLKKGSVLNSMHVRVWSKVRKCFFDFIVDNTLPFSSEKQIELLSLDNLAGYENV